MKKMNENELTYWTYETGTYMVKFPFKHILSFKKLLNFKTKKEAKSEKFLSDYMVYKEGLKGSILFIQKQIDRELFDTFIKENKKQLNEDEIEINKLKQ